MNKSLNKDGKINCAKALTNILEMEDIKYVFGHPGEQILSFYEALRTSQLKHILLRHEQSAAHAADGYARASGKFGICVATAGPGALNLIMGVATAYRDSIPILVITGDVPVNQRGHKTFQDVDLCSIFKPITLASFYSNDASEAILNLKTALNMLNNGPTGPVHVNLPKDVLDEIVSEKIINESLNENFDLFDDNLRHVTDSIPSKISELKCSDFNGSEEKSKINEVINLVKSSKKPLIIAGAGLIWSGALKEIMKFVEKTQIPLTTTYHGRGILSEDDPQCLGLIGNRGTPVGNYAGENCDLVLGLGCRLSERTLTGIGPKMPKTNKSKIIPRIVQVNLDKESLKGDINLQMDVKEFLNEILKTPNLRPSPDETIQSWWKILEKYQENHPAQYDMEFNYSEIPLRPQQAIKEIVDASKGLTVVNDAGTHTTWVTLYKKVLKPFTLLFSGAFGPMGYGLPAAIGVCFARPDEPVLTIVGDGGFQMTLQELATIHQNNLPIVICIINNNSLGIIRQWQEMNYSQKYEVELDNPDFVKLAQAYGIEAKRVKSPDEVFNAVKYGIKLKKPFLIEIIVKKDENIPLPDSMVTD